MERYGGLGYVPALYKALSQSHWLLREYAQVLNASDGRQREIPESLDEWIERVCTINVLTASDLDGETWDDAPGPAEAD